jgi:uncharacterized membrane protein
MVIDALPAGIFLVYLTILIVVIAGLCKVYSKAGQRWWAAIIPIYNLYILLKIVCKPAWWLILYFIPVVGIIIGIIVTYNLAGRFGRGIGFTIGLLLLPVVFYPILGFGNATYQKC